MVELEHTIDIEELTPTIEDDEMKGVMIFGKAVLAQNDPTGEPTEFYVKRIILDGDVVLRPDNRLTGVTTWKGTLFKAIADQIQNDRTDIGRFAQAEFNEVVKDARQPDPDQAYDEMRDRRMGGIDA